MHYLVTGGAGFIGSNYVHRLLNRGESVTVYDNLSRKGAIRNLAWLLESNPERLHFVQGDIRDAALLTSIAAQAEIIIHLASQVAVTTSVLHPREDFEINALGTFNVLEAARLSPSRPAVIYASTNKVYGGMEHLAVNEEATRYAYRDLPDGISEEFPLDFHSPYGCSKGTGDQYVRDYTRIYNLKTVVFRQSCIYGPRQFGIEDQGWVAWFIIAAVMGHMLTIYGDGKQVRDLLYIEDLLDAYDSAVTHIDRCSGQIYNVGGGPANQLSVWREFQPLLEELVGHPISVKKSDWRPGDQKIFVSNIHKAKQDLGWQPQIDVHTGIRRLHTWVVNHQALFTN
ncbi:MAG: GDP-mannose 4,6-dehydratase [Anaerolineae bacterium]|nr:GDP-mannose 4,6-dehydratase [Anaerolineae bacterium]